MILKLNLGGWSDTPPFCLERGGDILNMAVLLNKQLPITSEARIIPEPIFRLKNIEANTTLEISRDQVKDLFDYDQPGKFQVESVTMNYQKII